MTDLSAEELKAIHRELRGMRTRLDAMRFQMLCDQLSAELRRDCRAIRQDMVANTRLLFFATIGSVFTAAGLAFTAARFG